MKKESSKISHRLHSKAKSTYADNGNTDDDKKSKSRYNVKPISKINK